MNKKKITLFAAAGVLLVLAVFLIPFLAKVSKGKDYKEYLAKSEVEEGTDFKPLKDKEPSVDGMVLVAENDQLKLYTNTSTTEVALYDKANGKVYYSNPIDREGRVGTELDAQLSVTYYDSARQRGTMDNYTMSVEKEQFTTEAIENGIRYTYTIGDFEQSTGIVPLQITKERLEMFLEKMSDSNAKNVKKKYVESKDIPGLMLLLESAKTKINIGRMTKGFEEAGYTQEDYAMDMEGMDVEESVGFVIPLEYRLTEDGLKISIETSEIQETGGAQLYSIGLTKYFGAANLEAQGYMFVPNGSGSLINFNNGKGNTGYTQYVYDIDPTVASFVVLENTTTAQLPVYGLKYEDGALFSVISEGEALARIDASSTNSYCDYNIVYTTFYVRGYEMLQMFGTTGAEADLPAVEKDLYQTTFAVEYIPLAGEEADYSGMASYYRERLVAEGVLGDLLENEEVPFYLDVLGGVNVSQNIAGINFDEIVEMTTYEEALEIVKDMTESGVSNIQLNYLGWFNGGYYHDVPDRIKNATKLGSKKDMEQLNTYLQENGGNLYGNVAFNNVTYDSDRYYLSQEAAKYYAGKSVMLSKVCPYTLRRGNDVIYKETMYSLLSPRYLNYYVESFLNGFADYDMSGIALRDLANTLTSDKKRSDFINRQMALDVTEHAFETLEQSGKELLVHGGNAYSLAYTKNIVDAPIGATKLNAVDETVPFYEMVIHGYINYAGAELNLEQSVERNDLLLDLIEAGAAPRYVVSYKNSDAIKYSGMNDMYSVRYDLYEAEAKEFYAELSEALGDVTNVAMTEHEILENDVRKVTYENGVTIYINRSDENVEVDGITIPSGWYSKGESK